MKYRKLGTTSINVSVICLGTMTWGEQNNQSEAFEQMDYAFDQGVNFFDTAELYSIMPRQETYGKTEEIIGNWFQHSGKRKNIVLATKIASKSTGLEWIRAGKEKLGFDKKNINAAVDASLKRLQTDYIDLYQLHWPERKVPLFGKLDFSYDEKDINWTSFNEVLENLNDLVKTGKIRHIGLSNETPWGMMKFLEISKQKSLPRMMSIQNAYNLVNRVFDTANSEVAIRENCGLLAYSPIAGGRLSGKYLNGVQPNKARYTLWPHRFSRHSTERGDRAIQKYVSLAKKYNLTAAKMANAFVNYRPFVTSNIIGATTIDQLKENIDSINITLSDDILKEIEEIHSYDPSPCV